jgi:hypothetical protein
MPYTIDEFCLRQKFSKGLYYKLQRAGKGPRTMQVLGCTRISEQAEQDFIKACEEAAAAVEAA